MKKRVLSLLICLAMLTAVVPFVTVSATKDTAIAVPEGETLIFSEDFNVPSGDSRSIADYMQATYPRGSRPSDNTGAFLSFWGSSGWGGVDYHDSDNTLTYAQCNEQKKYAVPMCTSTAGQAERTFTIYLPTTNKPSTGVARVRMNIGFSKNSTYLTRCNVIAFEGENRDSGSTIMNIDDVNTLESNNGNTGEYAISTWYDFDLSVDLDNDYYWFRMTEHDTGDVVLRKEGVFDKSTFGGINFALTKNNTTDSWGNCAPRIDNLLVTTVNDSTGRYMSNTADEIFTQDFENFYCVQKDADPVAAPPKFTTHFGYVVSDGLYNGSKSLVGSQDHKQMAVNLSVGDVRTEGKYSLRYKFYPAAKNNALYIAPSQAAYGRPWQRESGHAYIGLGNFDSNRRWFDVEVIVDLDDDEVTFTAYEDGTDTVFYTVTQAYAYNLGVFDFSQDNEEVSGGTHSYFGPSLKLDNVVFKHIYESRPVFTSGNIKCYAGDVLQGNLGKVGVSTNKVKIEFPQKIKYTTITSGNIYVTDKNNNVVSASAVNDHGYNYTLTFDSALSLGTYTVHVKNLENVSGYTMNSEFTQNFTVVQGYAVSYIPDYNFAQDFEGSDPVEKDPEGGGLADPPKFTTHFGYVVSDNLYNGSKSLVASQDHKQMAVNLSVGDIRTEGVYSLKYKFYPAAKNNALYIAPSQVAYGRPWQRTSGHAYFGLGNFDSNRRWFDVEVIVDLDNDEVTFTAYEDGTSTVFYTLTQEYTYDLGVFDFSQDNDEASGTHSYFGPSLKLDDVVFSDVYDDEPSFTASNFKLYAGSALQANLDKVSMSADKVKVEFPQKIKYTTITSENIYVTDKNDEYVPVSAVSENGYDCTLTFSSALSLGTYTIHVKNLENVSGYSMSDEITQEFTVVEGSFSGIINSITTSGGDTVTGLSAFTAGTRLSVNYGIQNTTTEAKSSAIIVAYYNITGGIQELVQADVMPGTVAVNTSSDSMTQEFTVPQATFNRVDIMLWNNVARMQPLSDTISFE